MAEAEDSVMVLSSMLYSPRVRDFKRKVEIWVQHLQELGMYSEKFYRNGKHCFTQDGLVYFYPVFNNRGASRALWKISAEVDIPQESFLPNVYEHKKHGVGKIFVVIIILAIQYF